MKRRDEKILLLQGIQALASEMDITEPSLELLQRYNTLVACLVNLNWQECGQREGEMLHSKQNT